MLQREGLKFQAMHFFYVLQVSVLFSFFLLVNLDHYVLKYHFLPDSAVICMVNLRNRGGDCFLSGKNLMRYAFLSALSGNKTFFIKASEKFIQLRIVGLCRLFLLIC